MNPATAPSPQTGPAATPAKGPGLEPTFGRALRGIWLFTWRPQLAFRRLPLLALGLLALPVVIYLTTSALDTWSQHRSFMGNPGMPVNELARRLARADLRLKPEQHSQLSEIFGDEFRHSDERDFAAGTPEAVAERQRAEVKACYDRIHARVQSVLNDEQMQQFRSFEKRNVLLTQQRVRPAWNRTEPFYHWLLDLYFFVILPLQCVRGSGGLIRDELQADTLGFLLTRPLSRARLLILKYLAQTGWLQIAMLGETLLIFLVGYLRQIPNLGSLLPLFLAAQFLAVFAWSALGVFLGLLAKRYMALALLYGLIVEMGIGRIPTNINTLSLVRHLKTLLSHNTVLQSIYEWPSQNLALSLASLVFGAVLFTTLAALLFTFREYHHTAEMQK
jgi:hypothetical protein